MGADILSHISSTVWLEGTKTLVLDQTHDNATAIEPLLLGFGN
jgi:hypothetical protein